MSDLKKTLEQKVSQTRKIKADGAADTVTDNTADVPMTAADKSGDSAVDSGEQQVSLMDIQNQEGATTALIPGMAVGMEQAKARVRELQEFIKYMMVPSIDYGFIPGCPKPMLFKSGAEKLCDIYGLTKEVEIMTRMEDWDKGIFHYEVKAKLINKRTGQVEAEGVGSCNNKEKKFASQDPFSVVNSILKMAKKRAIVDATLAATRTSGIFGQDLDNHAA